jgi:hypothetical protein
MGANSVNYVAHAEANITTRNHSTASEGDREQRPDPDFLESGGIDPAGGLSTYPKGASPAVGTADQYAAGKAAQFPLEGGPAIVEIEVPQDIIDSAIDAGGEIRFEPSFGLEELLHAWPTISRRIV